MLIPIVFSTDHNFVTPTCVTICSLLKTSLPDTRFSINILANPDVTEEDRNTIKRQVKVSDRVSELNFVDMGRVFEKGYETRGISTACYSRLLIPWLLPQFDKVIYSDVDIIYKGDISDVFSIDLENHPVAGVTGEIWNKRLIRKYLVGKGLTPESYVNSGFLLINCKLQREENLREKYLELVKEKFVYQDQDIINIACKGRIYLIEGKYNVKPSIAAGESSDVRLIHFIGLKPWQYFTYCWDDWWSVCKESEVFNPKEYKKLCAGILSLTSRCRILKKQVSENIKFRFKLLSH